MHFELYNKYIYGIKTGWELSLEGEQGPGYPLQGQISA